ncbi:MAG: protease inhibitor I42 family protein [Mycobacteriales bacterium]
MTAANNGQRVTGAVGDTLKVELTACTSCGYTWHVTGIPSPAVLRYDGEQDVSAGPSPAPGSPPVAGGHTTQVFTYTAVGAHTTGLQAGYYGPGTSTPSQTYSLTIQITS